MEEKLKNIFVFVGSAAGVYSFIRLLFRDCFSFFHRPRLTVEFNSVEEWRVGPPYIESNETRRVATVNVCNKGSKSAIACEAHVEICREHGKMPSILPLHWADTPYGTRSTSIERVDIGRLPRRLDIVFTQERQTIDGCSIASAQALATGVQRDQFYLAPGEYYIVILVNYDSGKSAKKKFTVKSPAHWQDLQMTK